MSQQGERRRSLLTKEDLAAIAELVQARQCDHQCAFNEQDIATVKEVVSIFQNLKLKIIDSIYKLALWLLIGLIILISTHNLWKGAK